MFEMNRLIQRVRVLVASSLSLVLIVGCTTNQPAGGTKTEPAGNNEEAIRALIAMLKELKVDGPSRGGPYRGIVHNDVTRRVVQCGQPIVPPLLSRLEVSGYDESVYIVFCLRELKAKAAKSTIAELKQTLLNRKRFNDAPHDATLQMQVTYFLRDVESWE